MMHTVMPHVEINTTRPVKRDEYNIEPMLALCWANVYDTGPALSRHWFALFG